MSQRNVIGLSLLALITLILLVPALRINLFGIYYTYEECVTHNLSGTGSDMAARGIIGACGDRFSQSKARHAEVDLTIQVVNFSSRLERDVLEVFHETSGFRITSVLIAVTDGNLRREFECRNTDGVPPRSRGNVYCQLMTDGFDVRRWSYVVVKISGFRG